MPSRLENVVIGGGPAGSMLALRLAAAGRDVTLFEKQREPHHKVCGEFLSTEALAYLQRVGIYPQALGAHLIHGLRLHAGRKSVQSELPFHAESLSRFILDEALLQMAQSAGCKVHRGAFVEKLLRNHDGFSIHFRGGQTFQARSVFLATGKHDLLDLPRPRSTHPDLVGFKMHWQLAPKVIESLRHNMELYLFRDGYGGLALIEGDIANLCFVIHQRQMRTLGRWPELLSVIRRQIPALDQILDGAAPCWPKPLAISPIPYGYIAKTSNGIWRIGDQSAVIPSFTGDGMSIALHSAELAAEMFLSGKTADEYLARLRTHLRSGMRIATTLSRAMVTTAGRRLAPHALSIAPNALNWIARRTRIPQRALHTTDSVAAASASHSPLSAS